MYRKKTIQSSGRPLAALAAAVVSVVLVVACSSTSSTTPSPTSQLTPQAPLASSATPSSSNSQYMTVDSTTKTVNLMLNITGFSFDGYSNGQMTVNVPQGWKVNVQCNNQTTSPHSCAVVAEATSTGPAFSGGSTTNPTTGLQPGHRKTSRLWPAWQASIGSLASYQATKMQECGTTSSSRAQAVGQ